MSETQRPPGLLLPTTGFVGLLLLLIGGLCGMGYLALMAGMTAIDPELLGAVVAVGSTALLLLLLGAALARGAMTAMNGRPGRRFGPARPELWLLLLLLALVGGAAILALGRPDLTLLAFTPLHLAVALLPALTAVAYVAGRGGRPSWLSWRGVLGRLAWGAGVATTLALLAETIVGGALLILVALALNSSEAGRSTIAALQDLAETLSEPGGVDPSALDASQVGSLMHPAIVMAIFLLMAVLGPAIEELIKLAGVILRPPSSRAQAWAWGVATGAGFGILESLFFSALDLSAADWPAAVLVRALATLMHASMTGLAALGWYALTVEGRTSRGLTGIALAILGHGLWNGLALGVAFFGLLQVPALAALCLFSLFLLFGSILLGFLAAPGLTQAPELEALAQETV